MWKSDIEQNAGFKKFAEELICPNLMTMLPANTHQNGFENFSKDIILFCGEWVDPVVIFRKIVSVWLSVI